MMIAVQNRLSIQETLDNAAFIDSNPLKIYDSEYFHNVTESLRARLLEGLQQSLCPAMICHSHSWS